VRTVDPVRSIGKILILKIQAVYFSFIQGSHFLKKVAPDFMPVVQTYQVEKCGRQEDAQHVPEECVVFDAQDKHPDSGYQRNQPGQGEEIDQPVLVLYGLHALFNPLGIGLVEMFFSWHAWQISPNIGKPPERASSAGRNFRQRGKGISQQFASTWSSR
jgi:hypothetical protein